MRWQSWLPSWFAVVVAIALLAIGHGPLAERVAHHWPYSMLLLIVATLLGFARRAITGASVRPDQPPNDNLRTANQRVLWQTGLGLATLGIVLVATWPSPRSGGFEATLFGLAMGSILLIGMSLSMRKRNPK